MSRKKLEEILTTRQTLIDHANKYPLSVALLWSPHCHRWQGIETERDRGCGNPMKRIKGDIFRCEACDITEHRTSQKHSLLSMGSESLLISGGNRAGKTQIGAMLSVACAAGRNETQ